MLRHNRPIYEEEDSEEDIDEMYLEGDDEGDDMDFQNDVDLFMAQVARRQPYPGVAQRALEHFGFSSDADDDDDDDFGDDDDDEDDVHAYRRVLVNLNINNRDDDNAADAVAVDDLEVEVLPDNDQDFREDYDQDVQDHLCPICFVLLQDPVGCGVCQGRFCRECLFRHYSTTSQQHRTLFLEQQHAKCPTCRNSMQRGVVPDPRYAAFLASEPFTCRFAHCGLRILASQMRYHETWFCQGVRVGCRYATLGCDWIGYKQDVRAHEDYECEIANNPGLLAYISKNRSSLQKLTRRIRNLEDKQAHDMRLMHSQVQQALTLSRRQLRPPPPPPQRPPHRPPQRQLQPLPQRNTLGNRLNVPWARRGRLGNNNDNDNLTVGDTQQEDTQQEQQNKATNPLHLIMLVCYSFVTPGAIIITNNTDDTTNNNRGRGGVWRTLIGSGRERATVHNVMVLLPTILLGIKLTLRGWNHRHDFLDALFMMMRRGKCTILDNHDPNNMTSTANATMITQGRRFYSCVKNNGSAATTSFMVGALQGDGSSSWSLSDWMSLLAIPISGVIALLSFNADRLSPLSWASSDITDGENEEDLSYFTPRPLHRTWMNANFTCALLAFYACSIPLLQSIFASSGDDDDSSDNKGVAIVFGSILYASLVVPSILICFLNAASRNAVAYTEHGIRRIVPICLVQGNANASLLTALSYGLGMLFAESNEECFDGWYWTLVMRTYYSFRLAELAPRLRQTLKFMFRLYFHVDCRTDIYLSNARVAFSALLVLWWAKGWMQEYLFPSSTDIAAAAAATINDYQGESLLELDEDVAATCPVSATLSSKVFEEVSYIVSFFGRRIMVFLLVMVSLAALDEVLLRSGVYGYYLFKQEALQETFVRRSLRSKISWPGTGIFVLYLFALKQICEV